METRLVAEPDGLRDRALDAREQFNGVLLRADDQGPARGRSEQSPRQVALGVTSGVLVHSDFRTTLVVILLTVVLRGLNARNLGTDHRRGLAC